ncbi:diguanylate cyclase/phosphodiesterase with PAS/PAC sensor [Geminocystis sp. NIES-3709]|nr:diguanylate cyclase/phosphodiesterase with PAS/PAC sensor [Geminocystis sp. NIES-3709]
MLRVGIYQNNPKVFLDENGKPSGFWVEIMDGIAKRENWSIIYIPCEWNQCLKDVENGTIDLMVDVAYSDKRDNLFDFNNEVVLASWSQVYARPGLSLNSILDLDGKKVGILKSSIQKEVLKDQISSFGITPELVEVDKFNDIFVLLEQGKIDAGIVNNFFGKKVSPNYNVVKTNILVNPARLHFVVKESDPNSLLSSIDRQLQILIRDPNSIYYQAINEWLEPEKKLGWPQIRDFLWNLAIYAPFLVLIFLTFWNYFLNKEINHRKRIEVKLQESKQSYASLASAVPVGIFRTNANRECIYINKYYCELIGINPEEAMGHGWVQNLYPDDRETVIQHWLECVEENKLFELEYRFQRPDNTVIWVYGQCVAEYDLQGNIKGYVGTITDISDRIHMEKELKHNALHDKLTGLANRALLIERLQLALKRGKRYQEYKFAVLFFDLDNFKIVNDSLGHLVGDELLIQVAQLLNSCIRDTDIAARLGGDEFVILLEEIEEIKEAVRIADRILNSLRSPFMLSNREVFIGSSIGIIIGSQIYDSPENLLRDADIAMYRAKQNSKGKYVIFDPTMHSQALQRLHLENDLRRAIETKEFVLYYQPIFNMQTMMIEGFEALIRWQHPERGLLSPMEFIDIIEETGLIIPLGTWILENVCSQLAIWQEKFNKPLKLHVNLSVKQLQESLLPLLDSLFDRYSLFRDTLALEITESMLIKDLQTTSYVLNQIKNKGISISIDDFGTGYSCFSYLHQLPVDTLKIDRSFVNILESDPRNKVIAESIIALCKSIGIKSIAEGIETEEQKQWLKSQGCQFGQGYLFSHPVSVSEATNLLTRDSKKYNEV